MRIRRNASYVVCAYISEQNCCNISVNGTLPNVLCVSSYPTPLCRHCHVATALERGDRMGAKYEEWE